MRLVRTPAAWLIGVAFALTLAACGQKGPLYLPDKGGKVVTAPAAAPAPQGAPAEPQATPSQPQSTPEQTPQSTPEQTPQSTPEQTPQSTSEQSPQSTPTQPTPAPAAPPKKTDKDSDSQTSPK